MNDSSFEYFYRKYVDQISRYISTHYQIDTDASRDVAQEVFIVLWEKHEEIYDKEEKMVLTSNLTIMHVLLLKMINLQ